MKIAVCSLYINKWYMDIVKYGKISLEKYCNKHGYDFHFETESTSGGVYDGKRDIPWYKIQLLLKILNNYDYDYVIWNDADSHIVNYDKKLENFIDEMGDKDILVARDWKSILNTGTMFIRNCDYTKQLLTAIWNNDKPSDPKLHEQSSLGDIYQKNINDAQNHIMILPLHRQNDFLSYWYSYFPGKCFILHATRCSHDRPGFIFTMDMFCTVKMDEETNEQFEKRQLWLISSQAREDIEHYLNGGHRRNLSARYIKLHH
jgi:hypothetical protein